MASSSSTSTSTSTSTSNSTPNPRFTYEVFLSFRGEDTRKNFTEKIFNALIGKGIHTFRDDDELRRGEDIASELLNAIDGSRAAVIIFSKNYANSRWCLDELVRIMKCRDKNGQLVIPVFVDVEPEVVRDQIGCYEKHFEDHKVRFAKEMERVNGWRKVLKESASLSGFIRSQYVSVGDEAFIQCIVEEVVTKLNQMHLNIAVFPVGIDSCVEDIRFLLSVGSNDVRIIGIHGMGGIGKTTIAKAIYNEVFHKFDGSSFLANVRVASEPNGLAQLQEQLLSDILMNRNLRIDDVDEGIKLIKKSLCHKRVLIVLDDVDQAEKFNDLAKMRDWFGPGSRIIITTRDKELLNKLKVDEMYEAKELNADQSLELFSKHAFREGKPVKDYEELSKGVVRYVGGLPLALEVLGSFLYDKKSTSEWSSALKKLEVHPHKQLKSRLLFDVKEKELDIFLDIAFFFIGRDKDYALKILDSYHHNLEAGINALLQWSLVTINENNEFTMRDLLRDMGREIVREQSPKEPGKRSRLWCHDEAYDVLMGGMGTGVEGLILNHPDKDKYLQVSTEGFGKMFKLKLLQLNNILLTGSYEHFSEELRWLCWRKSPLTYIPDNFRLNNLVVLDMQNGSLKMVWKETKELRSLKILNLSHSKHLTRTPDFLGLPSLEKLILEGCTSLVTVHQSIGHLNKLVLLNLKDCKILKLLPSSICKLKALESLNLMGCSKLHKLPEDLGEMDSLTELFVDESTIGKLPSSIGHLKNLRNFSSRGCKGSPSKSRLSFLRAWGSGRSNGFHQPNISLKK